MLRDTGDKINAFKTVLGYLFIVEQQKLMNMHKGSPYSIAEHIQFRS